MIFQDGVIFHDFDSRSSYYTLICVPGSLMGCLWLSSLSGCVISMSTSLSSSSEVWYFFAWAFRSGSWAARSDSRLTRLSSLFFRTCTSIGSSSESGADSDSDSDEDEELRDECFRFLTQENVNFEIFSGALISEKLMKSFSLKNQPNKFLNSYLSDRHTGLLAW